MNFYSNWPRKTQAIGLMLINMACFACMATTVRKLSETMPSTQIVCLRNLMSLCLILLWSAAYQRRIPRFPTARPGAHFRRAALGTLAMEIWFYSLGTMPLTLATALSFTTPIFSTIFAIMFLGERAGIRRWGAIMAGFLGVLVMLRPDTQTIHPGAFLVLFSSSLMGLVGVVVKDLTRTDPPETIVLYMSLFMLPLSLGPALLHWQDFTLYQLWLVLLIAFFSTTAHLLMTRAYMRAEMVVLMPFDFTRLIFTSILAYMVFGEAVTINTLAGSLIIVASTVYIAHREAKKRKKTINAAVSEIQ